MQATMCRLCLKNNTKVQHILNSELKYAELTLKESLYWIFGIEVNENDPYPKFICVYCEYIIQYISSYRTLYQRNQLILQQKLDEWEHEADILIQSIDENEQESNTNFNHIFSEDEHWEPELEKCNQSLTNITITSDTCNKDVGINVEEKGNDDQNNKIFKRKTVVNLRYGSNYKRQTNGITFKLLRKAPKSWFARRKKCNKGKQFPRSKLEAKKNVEIDYEDQTDNEYGKNKSKLQDIEEETQSTLQDGWMTLAMSTEEQNSSENVSICVQYRSEDDHEKTNCSSESKNNNLHSIDNEPIVQAIVVKNDTLENSICENETNSEKIQNESNNPTNNESSLESDYVKNLRKGREHLSETLLKIRKINENLAIQEKLREVREKREKENKAREANARNKEQDAGNYKTQPEKNCESIEIKDKKKKKKKTKIIEEQNNTNGSEIMTNHQIISSQIFKETKLKLERRDSMENPLEIPNLLSATKTPKAKPEIQVTNCTIQLESEDCSLEEVSELDVSVSIVDSDTEEELLRAAVFEKLRKKNFTRKGNKKLKKGATCDRFEHICTPCKRHITATDWDDVNSRIPPHPDIDATTNHIETESEAQEKVSKSHRPKSLAKQSKLRKEQQSRAVATQERDLVKEVEQLSRLLNLLKGIDDGKCSLNLNLNLSKSLFGNETKIEKENSCNDSTGFDLLKKEQIYEDKTKFVSTNGDRLESEDNKVASSSHIPQSDAIKAERARDIKKWREQLSTTLNKLRKIRQNDDLMQKFKLMPKRVSESVLKSADKIESQSGSSSKEKLEAAIDNTDGSYMNDNKNIKKEEISNCSR